MIFDWATLALVTNYTAGAMHRPFMGLVLHTEQGTEQGTEQWFCNPNSEASAHFGNPKSERLRQLVDTENEAWAEVNGNPLWISLENAGFGEALTETQLDNAAHLMSWLHVVENIPLQITDDVNVPGLGWHGMGGADWGAHYNCPGDIIKSQRQDILDRAQKLLGATSMSNFPNAIMAIQCPSGGVWVLGSDGGVGAYGGAPFLGSYPGLPPEAKQGSRRFLNLVHNNKNGYTLLADDGSEYVFPL